MPVRTSPRASSSAAAGRKNVFDEAALRAETEQRRAAYQAQLERDQRLLVGTAGLVVVLGGLMMVALTGAFGG